MELKTIRQVSLDCGISRRMLCYYEEIRLIKSIRKEDYAYRVYEESEIRRLQQIIILRKLQIPMKQIKDILNNQNAITVIEIFKQNISELDEEITALSAVKSILVRFIDELQQKANVRLKLDLLNDKTLINLVDSLSFSKHKIKEKVSMEELNKTSDMLNKFTEKDVRIIYIPPLTVASARAEGKDDGYGGFAKPMMQKFIDDADLFNIYPYTRIFGFNETLFATIPDGFDVPAPLTKTKIKSGLYATLPQRYNEFFPLIEWVENSDKYESNFFSLVEYINPISEFGIKSSEFETTGFTYINQLIAIKEISKLSNELKTKIAKLQESISYGKSVEINLTTMKKQKDSVSYTNGLITINNGEIVTTENFNLPLKIELRAKTDSIALNLGYGKGHVTFNWEDGGRTTLLYMNDSTGEWLTYKKCGEIPTNEFVDIEYILGKEVLVVKVNGELRHSGDHYEYIKKFKENPLFCMSAPIYVRTWKDATVTVESLRITEL